MDIKWKVIKKFRTMAGYDAQIHHMWTLNGRL